MNVLKSAIKNKRSTILKLAAAVIITFFFVYFIVTKLDPEDFKTLFSNIDIKLLLLAFLIYFIGYIVRSLRILILLKINPGQFLNMLFIVSRFYFLNKILPLKIGELTLVYFLKNEQNISYSRGFGAFLYLRILDLLAVPLFFVIAFVINYSLFFDLKNLYILLIFLISLILLVLAFVYLGRILLIIKRFFNWLSVKMKFSNKNFYIKFAEKYDVFTRETNEFIKLKNNLYMAGLTILSRLSILLVMFMIFIGFGIKLTFSSFIIGSTLAALAESIPVSGIGSFGTFEAGWTLGFMLMGYESKISFVSGFGVNIIVFIFTAAMLVISFFPSETFINLIARFRKNKKLKANVPD